MKLFSWCIAFLESVKRRRWLKKVRRYRVSWITYLNTSLLYLRLYHRRILNVIVCPTVSHWRRQLYGRQIQYNRRYHRAIIAYKKQHFRQKMMRRFGQQTSAVKSMKRGLLRRQRAKIPEYPEKKYPRSRYIGYYSRSRYIGFSYLRYEEKKSAPFWVEFHKKLFYRTDRIRCSMLTSLFLLIVYHQLPKKCEKFKLADDSHDTPVIKLFTIEHPFDYLLGFWSDDSIIYSLGSNHLEDSSDTMHHVKNKINHYPTYKNMRLTHMTLQSYSVSPKPKNEKLYKSIIFDQDLAKSIARSGCEVLEEASAARWATSAEEILKEGKALGFKFISWLENEVLSEFTECISAYPSNIEHVSSVTDLSILLTGLERYSLLLNDISKFKKISEILSYLKSKNDDSRKGKKEKIQMIMEINMNSIVDSKLNDIINSEFILIIDEDNFLERLFQNCTEIWEGYDQPKMMTDAERDIVLYGKEEESNNPTTSEAGYENGDDDTSNFPTSASGSQDNSNAVGSNISSYTEQSGTFSFSSNSIFDNNISLQEQICLSGEDVKLVKMS